MKEAAEPSLYFASGLCGSGWDSSEAANLGDVPHSILMEKLTAHGLDGRPLHWVKHWLDSMIFKIFSNLSDFMILFDSPLLLSVLYPASEMKDYEE